MEVNRIEYDRPSKRDVFLMMACANSLLSPDAQTQCGCVITTRDNRILGTGYNGFPRGVDNDEMPNIRPPEGVDPNSPDYKYPWVNGQHSERNAVNNCIMSPRSLGGGIAYVSAICCFDCTDHLWNNGVDEIYELIGYNTPRMLTDKDQILI